MKGVNHIQKSWPLTYHLETSPLICRAIQRTGFYMIGSSVMKELIIFLTASLASCDEVLKTLDFMMFFLALLNLFEIFLHDFLAA